MISSKKQHSLKAINLLLVITMMLAGVAVNVSPAKAAAGEINITSPGDDDTVVTAEDRNVDVAFTVDSTDNAGAGQYRILVGEEVIGTYSVTFTGGTGQTFARTIAIPDLADGRYGLTVQVNFLGETEWSHSAIAGGQVIVNNVDGIEITAPAAPAEPVDVKAGDTVTVSFTVDTLNGTGSYEILFVNASEVETQVLLDEDVSYDGTFNQAFSEDITVPADDVIDDGTYDIKVVAIQTTTLEATAEDILTVDNTIVAPVLTSPNGGEEWAIGSVHAITWDEYVPGEDVTISLYFNESLIAADVPNADYAWTVPPHATSDAVITIEVEDSVGNSASDTSEFFTIFAVDSTAPVVAMTAPEDEATIGPDVTLQASAADPESGIAKVEFYQDSVPLPLGEGTLVGGYYEFEVAGLAADEYTFYAVATNGIGLSTTSETVSVTVEVEDTTEPVVTIETPVSDEVVGYGYHFTVNATDDSDLGSMNLYAVDAEDAETLLCGPIAPEEGDPIFSCVADVPAGTVTIKAEVSDVAGNVGEASVSVTVDLVAPDLGDGLLTPADNAVLKLGTSVDIEWNEITEDNGYTMSFELRRGGVKVADIDDPWTVAGAPASDYEVCMIVTDAAGNTAEDCNTGITIWGTDTSAPSVSLTAPEADDYKGIVELKATALDAETFIQKVEFFVSDDAGVTYEKVGEATVVPYDASAVYAFDWDTTGFADGTYSIKAVATNGVGLQAEDSVAGVVIDNTAPVLSNMQPSTAAPISGLVTFSITVIDSGVGIGSVTFEYYNGEEWVDMDEPDNLADVYSINFDTTVVENGWLDIRVTAQDTLGNEVSSDPVSYFVQNGDLEEGQVVINLQVGWNLISMSLIPNDTSIEVLLADLRDSGSVVQVVAWPYNIDLSKIVEMRWNGVQLTDITDLEDGPGYWIQMSKPGVLVFEGVPLPEPPMAPPSYLVYAGWNLIGFKSQQADISAEGYLGVDVSDSMRMMYGYDAATSVYTQVTLDDLLEPGNGYWMAVGTNGTIYPPAW